MNPATLLLRNVGGRRVVSHCLPVVQVVGNNNTTTAVVRSASSSSSSSPPPAPSASATDPSTFDRDPEELRRMNRTGTESIYTLGKHRSNAMKLVHKIPIVEVDGEMAICDGGGGALGHPLEYISLKRPGVVEYCKYCNLRYTKKKKV